MRYSILTILFTSIIVLSGCTYIPDVKKLYDAPLDTEDCNHITITQTEYKAVIECDRKHQHHES